MEPLTFVLSAFLVGKKEDLEEWIWNLAADIAIRPVSAAEMRLDAWALTEWTLQQLCL